MKLIKLEHIRAFPGDMTEVFKLLNGFDIASLNAFFDRSFTGLKGHEFKLNISSYSTKLSNFFLLLVQLFKIGIT